MAGKDSVREIPYCTICLVIVVLIAHTMTLCGNMLTASVIDELGLSTAGWSNVGLGLSQSLSTELDETLSQVSTLLTAALSQVMVVNSALDAIVSHAGTTAELTSISMQSISMQQLPSAKKQIEVTEASFSQTSRGRYCTNRGGTLGSNQYSTNVGSRNAQACANYVASTSACGDFFDYGLKDGWCNCVPAGEECQEASTSAYGIYKVEASSRSAPMPAPLLLLATDPTPAPTPAAAPSPAFTLPFDFLPPDVIQNLNQSISKIPQIPDISGMTPEQAKEALEAAMPVLQQQLDHFMELAKPALDTIAGLVQKFSDGALTFVEDFSTTIDKIQKIFDMVMAKVNPNAGYNKDYMVNNTFALWDQNNDGNITGDEFKSVADLYGISALEGQKSEQLFEKYDTDDSGGVNKQEYSMLVDDEQIPGIMAVMLRQYASLLSKAGGNIAAARMRDEVAKGMVAYLNVVCAKNLTKATWIADRLTNGSLPLEFTADVLIQMALSEENPNDASKVDIGQTMIDTMLALDPDYLSQAVKLVSNTRFYENEGFNAETQPATVETITEWMEHAEAGTGVTSLLAFFSTSGTRKEDPETDQISELLSLGHKGKLSKQARAYTEAKVIAHTKSKLEKRAEHHQKLMKTRSAKVAFQRLFGGATALGGEDPAANAVINSGQHAAPETLQFAQWLNFNTTANAKIFQDECFNYTGVSSAALQSFANNVQGMTKKIAGMLKLAQTYASPDMVALLESQVANFTKNAMAEIVNAAQFVEEEKNDMVLENFEHGQDSTQDNEFPEEPGLFVLQKSLALSQAGQIPTSASDALSGVDQGAVAALTDTLKMMQTVLPTAVTGLKSVRSEVSTVSSKLDSIFTTFKEKGEAIFITIAKNYRLIWIIYFVTFALLTLLLLTYALWASGCCASEEKDEDEEPEAYDAPKSFCQRCCMCCSACGYCMKKCQDLTLCFWSCIILMELIVLVMFLVSIVLCLLAGVKAFVYFTCSQIYILGDLNICTGALQKMLEFLNSLQIGDSTDFATACETEYLLACQIISNKLMYSIILTCAGSLLAAFFTWQIIIESGVLHERARWRSMYTEYRKQLGKGDTESPSEVR